MFPAQIPQTDTDELLRCGDLSQLTANEPEGDNENTKIDMDLAHEVDHALMERCCFQGHGL